MMAIEYLIYDQYIDLHDYLAEVKALYQRAEEDRALPYLYPFDDQFIGVFLGCRHIKVLAVEQGQLVGIGILRCMDTWPSYLDFIERPKQSCAMMLLSLVHPQYRGMGIGKRLAQLRLDSALELGVKHIYATAHPDNIGSIKNLTELDMRIVAERKMFDQQLLRYLFYRQL